MGKNISILIACAIVAILAYSFYSNKGEDKLVLQNYQKDTQSALSTTSASSTATTPSTKNKTVIKPSFTQYSILCPAKGICQKL